MSGHGRTMTAAATRLADKEHTMSETVTQTGTTQPVDRLSLREGVQMAGAMLFVLGVLALGLHAISYAGY